MHFSFRSRICLLTPHPTLSLSLWGQCAMRARKRIPLWPGRCKVCPSTTVNVTPDTTVAKAAEESGGTLAMIFWRICAQNGLARTEISPGKMNMSKCEANSMSDNTANCPRDNCWHLLGNFIKLFAFHFNRFFHYVKSLFEPSQFSGKICQKP
jgi:hypothetical protein